MKLNLILQKVVISINWQTQPEFIFQKYQFCYKLMQMVHKLSKHMTQKMHVVESSYTCKKIHIRKSAVHCEIEK
jgi:hypothetical protein